MTSELVALEAERQRLAEALALAERDRQLLGYEIHDGIVQGLTAAAMHLEGAGRQATFASTEMHDNFAGGLKLLRETIAEARRLVHGLALAEINPVERDDRGLVSALARLVEKIRIDHGLAVTFASEAEGVSLPASAKHLLLRIAQEALFNVWKHAQAKRVEMRLTKSANTLLLSIADDGVGFDLSQAKAGHFGLEGMRARARVLAAELSVESALGQGTRIEVRVPLAEAM